MNNRVEFANTIRGVASLVVMLAHLTVASTAMSGAYGGLSKIESGVFVEFTRAVSLGIPNFSYGTFGVALFFLVSGFVIPFSLKSFSYKPNGALGFFVSRFFRIWPVYVFGFLFSIFFRWLSFKIPGAEDSYGPWDFFIHMTLFRDWFGGIPLDGIVWTLEVEIKFYILSAIFAFATLQGKQYLTVFAMILSLVGWHFGVTSLPIYGEFPSNLLFSTRFILFMTIGTNLYLLYSNVISKEKCATWISLSAIVFLITSDVEKLSFIIGFLVFFSCFLARDSFKSGGIFGFFANISYPLYVTHALFGYVGLWCMLQMGLNEYVALAIQIAAIIGVAYLVHLKIEIPSQAFGKYIANKYVCKQKKTVFS